MDEAEQQREKDRHLRAAAKLTVIFMAFTLVVFTVSGYFRGPVAFREALTIGVPMMTVDGLIGFSLFFLLRAMRRTPVLVGWPLLGVGVIMVALTQAAWDTQLRIWIGSLASQYQTVELAYVRAATLNIYNAGMLAALLAFHSVNLTLHDKQRLLVEAQRSERDAHMLALRFQLNPHFLFNTLNAISSLIVVGRAADADQMLDRLSSFLRASLNADPQTDATVEEEFEMLDSYLQIESVRFGDRLAPIILLPPEVAQAQLPPFLLQPLVENAIKYAVAPSVRPVEVRIAAEARDDRLILTIADSGAGGAETEPGTGVGLANVRERLRLNYGARATLVKHQDASGCRVIVSLPLELQQQAAPVRRAA